MKYNWNEELLKETVKKASCWFDWLGLLGIPKAGCNYRTLKAKAEKLGIDTSHFNHDFARTHNGRRMIKNMSDEEFFSDKKSHHKNDIKEQYIKRILNGDAHCEICGISNWQDKPIVLQIHHKDGNNKNNVINNLQLLCPNCHSQTETYSNKKRK